MSSKNILDKNKKIFIGIIIIEFIIIVFLLFLVGDNLSNPYKAQKVAGGFIFEKENLENTIDYVCFFKMGNSYRRDFFYTIENPENVIRIIALGDSFVWGMGVPLNETWPKLLEKRLNTVQSKWSYQVLSFGIPGLSASEKINLLYSEGLKYTPDIVILHYICDDLVPQEIVNNPNETEVENWHKTNTNYTLLFEKEVEISFKRLADVAQKNNIKILIIFDPSWDQFQCKDYQKQRVEQISREYDWGFLGLSHILENYDLKDIINASTTNHPTPLGHKIRADTVFDHLLSNVYINNK